MVLQIGRASSTCLRHTYSKLHGQQVLAGDRQRVQMRFYFDKKYSSFDLQKRLTNRVRWVQVAAGGSGTPVREPLLSEAWYPRDALTLPPMRRCAAPKQSELVSRARYIQRVTVAEAI